ncbi:MULTISPECIES: ATP-binding protein [unclassified Leeuwenhoekiella]|uniref:ATP-binding protein n=1 Tax=unclassified Leeuwenhoekiella TaxID=2615029 RepID=UPI000C3D166D|nr:MULTISPECIES: ATP-binding protein [unclassified Leeuwenhoekiella]MAW94299.1 ATPase [Leeuwenhoekiella sp.]MBA82980.1 ATPase [Leeuwenhoekiella sp.]|tara:strand:- start:11115 stop:12230 length:1116 start_codon:yes stop_codon:yes gene_type:complete
MINRDLELKIEKRFGSGKVILLIGPRQVGKTTLFNKLLKDKDYLFLNGDDPTVRKILTSPNLEQLKNIIGNYKLVFIDEAQRIEHIGLTLKLITDQLKDIQVLVSGSSAFELNNYTQEPLTGRKWEYQLFPISWSEFEAHAGYLKAQQQLELRIIYGMYPEVITHFGDEKEILKQLTDSYLYKDLLSYGGIRKPEILEKLLRALAFQIGSEVSYNELAQLLGIDKKTVASYIDLLSQAYVVFKLPSYSKNLRNEIKTNQKIYFYDTGVRNMIIGDLNPLELRQDKGNLWENFLIAERLKQNAYTGSLAKSYFWRTVSQQEVDYVEEEGGRINAFEFKWNPNSKVKIPKTFEATYDTRIAVIHNDNFRDFLK